MPYSRGNNKQIIVGAAALFVSKTAEFDPTNSSPILPDFTSSSYKDTLQDATTVVRNVGYTTNGIELQFQPDFGEVQVDQLLDVARLYKQGMQVTLNTTFAEATLENLVVAIAANAGDYDADVKLKNPLQTGATGSFSDAIELFSGNIGECPVERGLIAVGPGTGDCAPQTAIERIYVAYRALSIDNVTLSAKRDEASLFDVSFRLLPSSVNGSYGRIVDRLVLVS